MFLLNNIVDVTVLNLFFTLFVFFFVPRIDDVLNVNVRQIAMVIQNEWTTLMWAALQGQQKADVNLQDIVSGKIYYQRWYHLICVAVQLLLYLFIYIFFNFFLLFILFS